MRLIMNCRETKNKNFHLRILLLINAKLKNQLQMKVWFITEHLMLVLTNHLQGLYIILIIKEFIPPLMRGII